jgi:hypothetical protein
MGRTYISISGSSAIGKWQCPSILQSQMYKPGPHACCFRMSSSPALELSGPWATRRFVQARAFGPSAFRGYGFGGLSGTDLARPWVLPAPSCLLDCAGRWRAHPMIRVCQVPANAPRTVRVQCKFIITVCPFLLVELCCDVGEQIEYMRLDATSRVYIGQSL